MAEKSDFTGDHLIYGYMSDYMDGELPKSLLPGFTAELNRNQKVVEEFQRAKGVFQVSMGRISAPEPLKHKLRNMIQDDNLRETMEASEIQEVERTELISNILRRTTISAIVLGLIGLGIYFFMPNAIEKIDVVEYLGYEAIAMEEDPEGRINLPTNELDEIKQFIGQVPGLDFKPQALRPLDTWVPQGVSIIDYDVIKVICVEYKSPARNNEHLHHFMFQGDMKSIPFSGQEADYRGIRYRVYASDKLNMLLWQYAPGSISVLAGHRSAPELAELARAGTPE